MEHARRHHHGHHWRRRNRGSALQRPATVLLQEDGCLCNHYLGFGDTHGPCQRAAAQTLEDCRRSRVSARPAVVVTHRIHEPVKRLLGKECEVVANDGAESWPRSKLLEKTRAADALLVFMPDQIDEAFLAECPRLKVISAAFKGYDNIDVVACTRRGVWVTIVPDLLSSPTAELALALVLGLTRNLLPGDRLIRDGKFQGWRPVLYGDGLAGKTVGILGMGKLGQAFARLLAGFDSRIVYHDPVRMSPVQEAFLGISRAGFDDVLAQSDVLV